VKIVEVWFGILSGIVSSRLSVVLAIIATLLLVTSSGVARSVTLAWDPSVDATVNGYRVHYGTTSQTYTKTLDTGSNTVGTVEGLVAGKTYYFVVTAYTAQGVESVPSWEISYTVPAPDPGELRLVRGDDPNAVPRLQCRVTPTQPYAIQASTDLKSWKTVRRTVNLTTNWNEWIDPRAAVMPKRFYRLAVFDVPRVPGTLSLERGAIPSGAIRLRPNVARGQHYAIQASEDLVDWRTIHEGVRVAAELMDFVDFQAVLFPRRFYRLALPDNPPGPTGLEIFRGGVRGGAHLRVAALAGQSYRVEASQDLVSWRTIYQGVSMSTEPVDLINANAGLFARRYYRLAFD